MHTEYHVLAARAENGELNLEPETIRRGDAASREAKRLLMEATGAASENELTRIALGRPSPGAPGG